MLKELAKYIYAQSPELQKIYQQNYSLQALKKFAYGDKKDLTKVPQNISREYQQAIFNREYERRHPNVITNALNTMNMEAKAANEQIPHKVLKALGVTKDRKIYTPEQYLSRQSISYENYNPVRLDGMDMVGGAPNAKLGQMIKAIMQADPSFNAQNTVGSADYHIDANGNVTLKDRYNINKGLHMGNWLSDAVHTWAKHQPDNAYNVNLNLGNINDWGLQYTGNDYNREIRRDGSNLLGRGIYEQGYEQ